GDLRAHAHADDDGGRRELDHGHLLPEAHLRPFHRRDKARARRAPALGNDVAHQVELGNVLAPLRGCPEAALGHLCARARRVPARAPRHRRLPPPPAGGALPPRPAGARAHGHGLADADGRGARLCPRQCERAPRDGRAGAACERLDVFDDAGAKSSMCQKHQFNLWLRYITTTL
ncbi:hypothetical protein OC844_005793, partial [Tilletia horrida]